MTKQYHLAVLTSHPIQYQAPLWRRLAQHPEIDLTVYFCTDFGVKEKVEPEFGISYKWDVPLLDGYRYKFLRNYSLKPSITFWGRINPGIMVELWKNRYDALFVHGHLDITNWMAFMAARVKEIPVLIRAIASLNYDLMVKRPFWIKILKKVYLRTLYRFFVSGFLSIGSQNKKFFLAYGVPRDRIFHCPYAVDNDFFMEESDKFYNRRSEVKSELGISADSVVILFAAKLIEKKNPMQVLLAYEKIVSIPNKALVFIGDGKLRSDLERFVVEKKLPDVFFFGFQNQKDVAKFYAISDIFVRTDLPDKGDWGATVNEALASGLPVICTNAVSSQADLIRQGENGFVYEVGDIERLAEIFRHLLADRQKLKGMRNRCREIISSWGYDQDVQGFLEALKICSHS